MNLDFNFDAKTKLKQWWAQVKNNFTAIENWANNMESWTNKIESWMNKIENKGVKAGHIADGAVTTEKLADAAVTGNKIASGAISSAKIGASAVGSQQIATSAVSDVKIASYAVTAAKLATNAVTTAKISAAAVTREKLGNDVTGELDSKIDSAQLKQEISNMSTATTREKGLMSAADKQKLDSLADVDADGMVVDSIPNTTSKHPLQNKVTSELFSAFAKACKDVIPKPPRLDSGEGALKLTDLTIEDGDIFYIKSSPIETDTIKTGSSQYYYLMGISGKNTNLLVGESMVLYFDGTDEADNKYLGGTAYILWRG